MRWSKGLLTNDLSKIQRSLEFLPLICNVPSRREISYGKRKARLIFIFAKFVLRSQFWLHNEMKVLKFLNHGGFIPKWHDCSWNYLAEKNMHICRWYISVCKAGSGGIDHSWKEGGLVWEPGPDPPWGGCELPGLPTDLSRSHGQPHSSTTFYQARAHHRLEPPARTTWAPSPHNLPAFACHFCKLGSKKALLAFIL